MSESLKPLLHELEGVISDDRELLLVKSLIIKFFNHNEKDYIEVPFEDFYKKITNKEIKAVNSIMKYVQNEGDISLSTLIAETGISRPVFISLLNKLKEHNIAEVTSRGAKGTHIKFLDSHLICGRPLEEKI